jgi:hypothetical protein
MRKAIYKILVANFKSVARFEGFEIFTAVKIQVEVFWFATPCDVAVGNNLNQVR